MINFFVYNLVEGGDSMEQQAEKKSKSGFLSKGIFNKPFMDSKVKTLTVTRKEKILGHLIGPLGLIFVINTIAALVEKFYTQQASFMYPGAAGEAMRAQIGSAYGIVMTIAKIIAIAVGILNGYLLQHTKSRQGRMRPWHLIFGFVSIGIGALIFLFAGNTLGDSYWYYFFIMLACYHTVGSTYFYTFRDNICSLVTRDPKEKMQIKFIRQMSWTLISGIVIGMLLSNVAIPFWLQNDINGYAILMIIFCVLAIPLLFIEYYYTKERIIDDVAEEVGIENENKIPLKAQMKALLTNKYFVIFTILMTITGIVDNFKGGNVQYFYINFMLDGINHGERFMLYSIITGVPLGLGAIFIYPMAKKFGIKNTAIVGYSCVLIGSILGWIFPSNLYIAMVAGFLRQLGMIPNCYIIATLLCYAFDSVEFKSGLRLEGLLGTAIIAAVQSAIYAPFAGGYETIILNMGFEDVVGVTPSANVQNFMTLSFYLFDIIMAVAYIIGLSFMDVEKHLPVINAELMRRKKEAVLSQGKEWIEPEEQQRREAEEANRIHEENRIKDLRARCEKRNLDFETENNKYLMQKAIKERKWKEKQAAKQMKASKKNKQK